VNLVSLRLVNIRSYKDDKIDFRNGITLFEGDIGSGKSSILNAVEFALFGLGDQSGSHLLRVGENEGKVELTILVNGKEYTFGRGLARKRGNVGQDQCYIVEDGVQTSYNATNMKRRALQILDFKEPTSPRSQSVIYRYAVFTPQEQMREVIRQRPEARKETLRKALGVEEYSIAAGNATSILSTLRGEAKALEKSRGEAELAQNRIAEEEKNIEEINKKIKSAEEKKEKIGAKKLRAQSELAEKKKAEAQLRELVQRRRLLEQEKKRLEEDITANTRTLTDTRHRLTSAEEAKTRCEELSPLYEEYRQIRAELPRLQSKYDTDRSLKQRIEIIRTEIKSKREAFENQLQNIEEELADLAEEIGSLGEKLARLPTLSSEISTLEAETASLDLLRDSNTQNQNSHKVIQQEIKHLENQKKEKREEWRTISSLGVGATCPRCQQKLSETHYKLLESKIRSEIEKIDEEIAGKQTTLTEIDEKIREGKSALTELELREKKLNNLRLEQVALKKDQETRERHLADEAAAKDKKSELESLLDNDSFASQQKEEIATIESEKSKLTTHVQRYNELRTRSIQLEESRIEDSYNESKATADRIPELSTALTTLESEKARLAGSLKEKASLLGKIAEEVTKYDGLETELSRLQEEVETLLQDEATQAANVKAYNADSEAARGRIGQLNDDLKRHRENLLQAESLQIVEAWLREILIPSLQTIEKNILLSLNQEFNKMFRRWFDELIESEELQGLIDEDFTPIVEQSGYGLEVESLSGGEKTSVALAYRLALNTIVKQVTSTMKSNLLILDEPTDGFSKEQLFKMRDILKELNCDQVILVSHEKELETVADHIYRVRKDGNTSTVSPPA
jgi:exonuclease SbcC